MLLWPTSNKSGKDTEAFLKRFEAIDTAGFPEQEILNQQLMVRNLKEKLESISLKLYLMPVDQFNGIHLGLAQFVPLIPFDTAKQYGDYIARLHQIPRVMDQVIRNARARQARPFDAAEVSARKRRLSGSVHRPACRRGQRFRLAR